MFKEAKLIIPIINRKTFEKVCKNLSILWGGFTLNKGVGYFAEDKENCAEEVAIFTIAMKGEYFNSLLLKKLAKNIAIELKQECVYIQLPSGEVLLIDKNGKSVSFTFKPGGKKDRAKTSLTRQLLND